MKDIIEIMFVKYVVIPIAKHFWNKAATIDAMPCGSIDELAAKADAVDAMREEYNSLPSFIKSRLNNIRKSMLISV